MTEPSVLYGLAVVLITISAFMARTHNWDLEHEIYFGSRLLHGELIWTSEFHDKLPFVPFLFALPAYFKSINVFLVFSIFCVVVSSFFIKSVLSGVFSKSFPSGVFYFCSAIYIFLIYWSYDSFLTINCIAVSFYTISFLMMVKDNVLDHQARTVHPVPLFWGSMLGAMAISIRPYYLPVLAVSLVLLVVTGIGIKNEKLSEHSITAVKKIGLWGVAIAAWGFVVNFLPYVVTGQISAFTDGLAMLASPINPMSGPKSFFKAMKKIPDIFFWISWLLMAAFMVFDIIKNKENRGKIEVKIFFISFLSGMACVAIIMTQHYWEHYIQLFIGNFCICLLAFLGHAQVCKRFSKLPSQDRGSFDGRFFSYAFIIFVVFLFINTTSKIIIDNSAAYVESHKSENITDNWIASRDDWREEVFLAYLEKNYPTKRPDFLFPDDMKAHWMLDEPRHHFLHAANTKHVFLGWWEKVRFRSDHFYVVSDSAQYCTLLKEHGPELVAMEPDDYPADCLMKDTSFYREDAVLKRGNRELLVFRRIAQP